VLASSLREEAQATVARKPITGEITKETVKTIARGMPGDPGVTVVTNACAFYQYTRGCGRIERPAFPAPSDWRGRDIDGKTRAKTRGEIAKPCLRAARPLNLAPPAGRGRREAPGEGDSPQVRACRESPSPARKMLATSPRRRGEVKKDASYLKN